MPNTFFSPPLFNSLGSNYTPDFVRLALKQLPFVFQKQNEEQHLALQKQLVRYWPGDCFFVYKGRDAIELALRAHGISGGQSVLIQAFTCFAIEEAIRRTKATPVFVDTAPASLNLGVAELEEAWKRAEKPAAVLVQHTLGWPADSTAIKKWCQKKGLLLIEDLAQSVGAVDESGALLGTQADVVIFSFGRDKIVDAVTGGAVVFRTTGRQPISTQFALQMPPFLAVVKDLTYPVIVHWIRTTYPAVLGKVVFKCLRMCGWLSSPVVSPTKRATALPAVLMPLVAYQLERLQSQLEHRRSIAQLYWQLLESRSSAAIASLPKLSAAYIQRAAPVRFPVTSDNPTLLAEQAAAAGLFISDRWYRRPVDAGQLPVRSSYQAGSCPNAELQSGTIANLPTHQFVSLAKAEQIINTLAQSEITSES